METDIVIKPSDSPYYYTSFIIPGASKLKRKGISSDDRVRMTTKQRKKLEAVKVAIKIREDIIKALDELESGKRRLTFLDALISYGSKLKRRPEYKNVKWRAKLLFAYDLDAGQFYLSEDGEINDPDGCIIDADTEINRYTQAMLAQMHSNMSVAEYAVKTINGHVNFIKGLIDHAVDNMGAVPPTSAIKWKDFRQKAQGKVRWLFEEEEEALLRELDPNRQINNRPGLPHMMEHERMKLQDQYDMAILAIDLGCRYSELAAIPWLRIDTQNFEHLVIHRTKVKGSKAHEYGTLYLTPRCQEVIKRRYSERKGQWLFCGYDATTMTVNPRKHRGYSTKGYREAFARAGLNDEHTVAVFGRFTFHSFRHTFATRALLKGVPLADIAVQLGHESTSTTEIYANLLGVKDSSKRIAAALTRPTAVVTAIQGPTPMRGVCEPQGAAVAS